MNSIGIFDMQDFCNVPQVMMQKTGGGYVVKGTDLLHTMTLSSDITGHVPRKGTRKQANRPYLGVEDIFYLPTSKKIPYIYP